jgi:hypothetical protein
VSTSDQQPPRRDSLELYGKWVGLIGGLVAVVVGLAQFGQRTAQAREELHWKRAGLARDLVTEMIEDEGWQAMTMLDWEDGGREYEVAPGRKVRISAADVYRALAPENQQATDTDVFIMDRFDRVFFLVSQMEAAITSGLIRREDVRFPLSWYAAQRMCPHKRIFEPYLRENAAPETLAFFSGLAEWNNCTPAPDPPPAPRDSVTPPS